MKDDQSIQFSDLASVIFNELRGAKQKQLLEQHVTVHGCAQIHQLA